MGYVNIYWHPRAGEFEGREHASALEAKVARQWELAAEKDTIWKRVERRDAYSSDSYSYNNDTDAN